MPEDIDKKFVESYIASKVSEGNRLFSMDVKVPKVYFSNEVTYKRDSVGIAIPDSNIIVFNTDFFNESWKVDKQSVLDTMIHEVAHFFAYIRSRTCLAHGPLWQHINAKLGGSIDERFIE